MPDSKKQWRFLVKNKWTYLDGRKRTSKRKGSTLLQDLDQRALVSGHDEIRGDINQMVHVGDKVQGRGAQESSEMTGRHSRGPELADECLSLCGTPELREDVDNGLWSRWHRVCIVCCF
jgi:hypothetical protein